MFIKKVMLHRMYVHFFFSSSFILILPFFLLAKLNSQPIEIRAAWMHPESYFSEAETTADSSINNQINRLSNANFNLIFCWIRSEEFLPLLSSEKDSSIYIEKLALLDKIIQKANSKNIKTHLWYSFTNYKNALSPEFNPKFGGSQTWAAKRIDEITPDKNGKIAPMRMSDVCPMQPEARNWELQLVFKILKRYPNVTGIHIEEPGYSSRGYCCCEHCMNLYQSIYGTNEMLDIDGPDAQDFKCLGITKFFREFKMHVESSNTRIQISANGSFSSYKDHIIGRDWVDWARNGLLDFYVPQVYTIDTAVFRVNTRAAIYELEHYCRVVVGIGVEWSGTKIKNSVEAILEEIQIARQEHAIGVSLFDAENLTDEYLLALKKGPFKEPAALPNK